MTTYRLGVFGNPIAHSRSPEIHLQFAEQLGLDISYERVLVPEGTFNEVAREFLRDGTGFNITLPCKHDAWNFVDETSVTADVAQAVNTVSQTSTGKLKGDNTDGPGLVSDLERLGWRLEGKKVLIIGAGGAVSGVLASLLSGRPSELQVCNRTHGKAKDLQDRFSGLRAVRSEELAADYDLVINGTSAGLGDSSLELPGHILSKGTRCYDMIYGAGTTEFNAWCLEQADCETSDGLGMLVEQAALAFEIWFGTKPETQVVIEAMRTTLK